MFANQLRTAGLEAFPFKRGDWTAFMTLGTDNLAKIVVLPAILIGTFHLAPEIVFGRIMPGLGLTLFIGLAIFSYMALRTAAAQGRSDVTALPYGISTPAMFVYLFGIMGPVYFASGDPLLAYRIGLGAAFIGGLIELSGALFGPLIQKIAPQAGILGTMAGVAIVWIAMTNYAFQATPPGHGVAVAFALVPHIADLLKKQLDGTLLEVFQEGPASTELLSRLAGNQGVYLQSYGILSRGAIITGLLWGSILAFLIDGNLHNAVFFSLLASILSLVGLIHAEQIGFSWSPATVGYLILTCVLGLFYFAGTIRAKTGWVRASDRLAEKEPASGVEDETTGLGER